jgi:hypothetical protein
MPKKWRRDERRRIAKLQNINTPQEVQNGHPQWSSLVLGCALNEDTTIATSTESVTIAAGLNLELPVHVETATAIVQYAFKVNDMDIDVSATCTPTSAAATTAAAAATVTTTSTTSTTTTTTTTTTPTKSETTMLDTVSLDASTGWLRGSFKPGFRCTCKFELSNEYSFFNGKEVLFEIKVKDDVFIMKQWTQTMNHFHKVVQKISRNHSNVNHDNDNSTVENKNNSTTTLNNNQIKILLDELKGIQIELEKIVCDSGSACMTPGKMV